MRINTNISSLIAQRYLTKTSKAIQRSLERLSSGSRINSAKDDPAGLAISSRLDSQVRGLARASQNINESLGLLNTADGALSVLTTIVQRMRELSVQAANGVLSSTDRGYLDKEFQQLLDEYTRLVSQTDFNGVKLIDGTFGTKSIQVGSNKNETIDLGLGSLRAQDVFTKKQGTGGFDATTWTNTSITSSAVYTTDTNNDGIQDIITIGGFFSYGDGINIGTVQLGQADGTYVQASTFEAGGAHFYEVGDVNGDGNIDLIRNDINKIQVQYGNGTGHFGPAQVVYNLPDSGSLISGMKVFDFNNDGTLDITLEDFGANLVRVLRGDGHGAFSQVSSFSWTSNLTNQLDTINTYSNDYSHDSMSLGDFNGDGIQDILTAYDLDDAIVRLGNGDGTFGSVITVNSLGVKGSVGDVNGDGKDDIVMVDGTVWIWNGSSFTQTSGGFTTPTDVIGLRLGDLNGDGYDDLVTSNSSGDAEVFIGSGTGSFAFKTTLTSVNYARIEDLNGDGVYDIVSADVPGGTRFSTSIQQTTNVSALSDMNLRSQSAAQDILETLDTGLQNILSQRAQIGALQNRLESSSNVTMMTRSNLAEAKSRILDTDIAAETAELVRSQILRQAQISVLSQANLSLSIALALLRN